MGAFNVVTIETSCPRHRGPVTARVQFRYGDTWHHEYRVGDLLRWGGNDVGTPGRAHVVALGAGEPCPQCGFDGDWDFYVHLERDRIGRIEPADNRFDFSSAREPFVVLRE